MKISGFCPFLTIHPLDIHVLIIAKMQYVTHHLVPFGFFFFISYFIVLLIYTPEKIICYTDCYVTFLLLHNMKCTVTLLPVELLIDSLAQIPTICLLVFVWTHRKKVRILTFFSEFWKKRGPHFFIPVARIVFCTELKIQSKAENQHEDTLKQPTTILHCRTMYREKCKPMCYKPGCSSLLLLPDKDQALTAGLRLAYIKSALIASC